MAKTKIITSEKELIQSAIEARKAQKMQKKMDVIYNNLDNIEGHLREAYRMINIIACQMDGEAQAKKKRVKNI